MAEIVSNVYDVVYPSPVPLIDLSSIAVAIQLWRLDLNQYRKNNVLEDFYTKYKPKPKITLQNVIPNIPSVINYIIDKYKEQLVSSMNDWIEYNFYAAFKFHRDNRNDFLNDFDDIACDYDGTIHYVRTAKRMMLCDRINQNEKFKIACAYCFEDSIRRIWPSVESKIDLNEIDFSEYPRLYYWVCCLRNEIDKIPNPDNVPIDDLMLDYSNLEIRSSFEYFWNRASLQSRYEKAIYLCMDSTISSCGRFILPKFNEQQLSMFVAEIGSDLVYNIWTDIEKKQYTLPIWMYIKDKMNEENFTDLVERMLSEETSYYTVSDASIEKSDYNKKWYRNDNLTICCEIWNSAATNLKRSAIKNILPHEWLYQGTESSLSKPREIRFISTVLRDATSEERKNFWNQNWLNFLTSTCIVDFDRLMKLCLQNETEIVQFENNTMTKYENLSETVATYFKKGYFKELTDLLNFCWPDKLTGENIKQQFLRSNFLDEHTVLCSENICKLKSFREFIDDAYADSPELAIDFQKQLASSPKTEFALLFCMKNGYFSYIQDFVATFTSSDQNVELLKNRLANELKEYLIEGSVWLSDVESFQAFLFWCLGSDEQLIKFKQAISPDEVVCNMVNFQKSLDGNLGDDPSLDTKSVHYPGSLDTFLSWYFNTPEEITVFKTRLAYVFETLIPRIRR